MSTFVIFAALVGCVDGETKDDTGTTTTTAPDPIAATGLTIACNGDDTEVTFTAGITGTPDEAILNMSDFANSPPFQEENVFSFDTAGDIQPLPIAVDGTATLFTCPGHFDAASAVMSYAVRLYSAGVLADCNAGSESGDAQAYVDDAGATPSGSPPSTAEDFAGCGIDLALTY